jgi:hypothetical protein
LLGPTPPQKTLAVFSFTPQCVAIGLPAIVPQGGGSVAFPAGTAFVAVFPVDRFMQLNWTLN